MRFLGLVFLLLVLSSQFAKAFDMKLKDAEIINYLQKDAQFTRYFKLYSALKLEAEAAAPDVDPEIKTSLLDRATVLRYEAKQSEALDKAITQLVLAQPVTKDSRAKGCDLQIQRYKDAKAMVEKLETEGYLNAEASEHHQGLYGFSAAVVGLNCKN